MSRSKELYTFVEKVNMGQHIFGLIYVCIYISIINVYFNLKTNFKFHNYETDDIKNNK